MLSLPEQMRNRTKSFALRTLKLFQSLPQSAEAQLVGRQLLRASSSVAANYRAACRARSKAEFAAKLGIVIEEADESVFWLEMLSDSGIVQGERIGGLLIEANALVAIFVASRRTVKTNNK